MSRSNRRPAGACLAATILCLGILHWGFSPMLNLAVAGPLVLYLPGWAALLALDSEPDGWLESAVLNVALSLAIVVISGLLLHLAGAIARPGWLAALGVVTLSGCLISVAHGKRALAARPFEVGQPRARRASYWTIDLSMMAMAIGLAGAAVATSFLLTVRHHEFYYTQLWIVPKQDAPDKVVVGLRNEEGGDESYVIELLVDYHLVQAWSEVSLKQGEAWTTTFRWAGFGEHPRATQLLQQSTTSDGAPRAASQRVALGASPLVEALVYRSSNRSIIYRHVWTARQCVMDDGAQGSPPCGY
jgi:uncharacterized membrane protein